MPAYKICVNLFAVQAHGAVYNIYILGGPPASHIGLTIFTHRPLDPPVRAFVSNTFFCIILN